MSRLPATPVFFLLLFLSLFSFDECNREANAQFPTLFAALHHPPRIFYRAESRFDRVRRAAVNTSRQVADSLMSPAWHDRLIHQFRESHTSLTPKIVLRWMAIKHSRLLYCHHCCPRNAFVGSSYETTGSSSDETVTKRWTFVVCYATLITRLGKRMVVWYDFWKGFKTNRDVAYGKTTLVKARIS